MTYHIYVKLVYVWVQRSKGSSIFILILVDDVAENQRVKRKSFAKKDTDGECF